MPVALNTPTAMTLLTNVAQALPTNSPVALAINAVVPIPTNPASPLQAAPPAALAVPAYQQTMSAPAKTGMSIGLVAALALGAWFIFRRK